MFYTLGRGRGGNVYVYGIKLKQYVFSNEIIQVGISEIDDQIRDYYPRTNVALSAGGTGQFVNDEIVYQSANTLANATATAIVHDFTPNSQVTIIRTIGTFASGGTIKGNTSGAIWTINTSDDLVALDNAFEDIIDNNRIQAEANAIIDFTDTNPFGEP